MLARPWLQEKCQVSVDDVRRAVQEITQQAHLLAVRDSSPQERLLLVAICNEIHHGGKVSPSIALYTAPTLIL